MEWLSTPGSREQFQIQDRVQVYWPDDRYYFGTIQQYHPVNGWFILYDDGDEQWEVRRSLLKCEHQNGSNSDDHS